MTYPNGSVYTGQFHENIEHGRGKLIKRANGKLLFTYDG